VKNTTNTYICVMQIFNYVLWLRKRCFFFEVRHPCCVSQITKYKVDTLKSKHNSILYIANDDKIVNNYMFRPLKGHLHVVHLVKSTVQYTMDNVSSV
jgi:hypothetical protein